MDLSLDDFLSSLQDFNASMHRTKSTRLGLVKALSVAVDLLNAANPSTALYNTMRDNMPRAHTQRPHPRAAEQPKEASHPFQEPWRFGKPGAYISPVLQHRQEKDRAKLKKKAKRRPTSAKRVDISSYRNTDRERGVKLERPWSAPARRRQGPAKMNVMRLFVNLEGICKSPDETFVLLKRLAQALKPSSSSTVLPFLLNLNLKGSHLDATIEKFWRSGASECLRQILVHPGVEGVDMQQNGVQLLSKTGKTTLSSLRAASAVDNTQDYTADFEDYVDDDDDDELAALNDVLRSSKAMKTKDSTSLINLALEQRRAMQDVSVSPPLVDLFVDNVKGEEALDIKAAPVNLGVSRPPTEEEISEAFAKRLTVSHAGYVVDAPVKTVVPSVGVGVGAKNALPSFQALMQTISSANFDDLDSNESNRSSGVLQLLTESQELATKRFKSTNHQATFRMRAGSYHC